MGRERLAIPSTKKTDSRSRWVQALAGRSNANIATVGLANKNARIVWAVLSRWEAYRGAKADAVILNMPVDALGVTPVRCTINKYLGNVKRFAHKGKRRIGIGANTCTTKPRLVVATSRRTAANIQTVLHGPCGPYPATLTTLITYRNMVIPFRGKVFCWEIAVQVKGNFTRDCVVI